MRLILGHGQFLKTFLVSTSHHLDGVTKQVAELGK